ncbi:MAG: OmpA family protein [Deltaproteobacteria bacterium]|nr:OmpA family protein [Deltaproteobacteria bacterium]
MLFSFLFWPAASFAKSASYDALLFKPATDTGLYLGVYGADNLDQWDYSFGLYADYSKNALKTFTGAGALIGSVIDYNIVGNFYGAVGLLPFLSAGLDFPVAFLESFNDPTSGGNSKQVQAGDLRLDFKLKALDHYRFPVGIAIVPFVTFPTGSDTYFTGSGKFTGGGLVVIDSPRLFDRFSVSLNTGYLARAKSTVVSGTTMDDEFLYGLGANIAVHKSIDLIAEVRGSTLVSNFFKKSTQSPLEGEGAIRYYIPNIPLALTAGGGAGITKGVGTPQFRVLAGVAYVTPRPFGVSEYSLYEFRVPPESVYELSDKCPYSQGDFDTSKDNPQCSEVYILRELSAECPEEALYDPQRDNPNCAKVYVYQEQDKDRDGLTDFKDQCPGEAEVFNGYQDDDGCPDDLKALVLTEDQLVTQRIFFDFDKATLKPISETNIEEVAKALVLHTELLKVEVRGHTDNVGNSDYNLDLSQRRAKTVMGLLVGQGVDKKRLISKGLGATKPLGTNRNEEGRAKNRRVEFIILKRDESQPVGESVPAPALLPESVPESLPLPPPEAGEVPPSGGGDDEDLKEEKKIVRKVKTIHKKASPKPPMTPATDAPAPETESAPHPETQEAPALQ